MAKKHILTGFARYSKALKEVIKQQKIGLLYKLAEDTKVPIDEIVRAVKNLYPKAYETMNVNDALDKYLDPKPKRLKKFDTGYTDASAKDLAKLTGASEKDAQKYIDKGRGYGNGTIDELDGGKKLPAVRKKELPVAKSGQGISTTKKEPRMIQAKEVKSLPHNKDLHFGTKRDDVTESIKRDKERQREANSKQTKAAETKTDVKPKTKTVKPKGTSGKWSTSSKVGTAAVAGLFLTDAAKLYREGGADLLKQQMPNLIAQYGGAAVGYAAGSGIGKAVGMINHPYAKVASGVLQPVLGIIGGFVGEAVGGKIAGVPNEIVKEMNKGYSQGSEQNHAPATPDKANGMTDKGGTGLIPEPNDIQNLVYKIALEEGVDPAVALAVANAESGFNPKAMSPVGAVGVMQLMPATAKGLGVDPYNTEQNIRGGLRYLKANLKRNNNSLNLALAAYNAGQGNVNKYGGVPPFAETQNYINRIASTIPQFRERLGQYGGNNNQPPTNTQTPSTGGSGDGGNNKPSFRDMMMQYAFGQPAAAATLSGQPQVSPMAQQMAAARDAYTQQMGETVNPQMLYQALAQGNPNNTMNQTNQLMAQTYNNMNQAMYNDPRYQGDLIPAQGYNVDIDALNAEMNRSLSLQRLAALRGQSQGGLENNILNNAQMLYQAQMANQAGVPYEDYKAAMDARNANIMNANKLILEQGVSANNQYMKSMMDNAELVQKMYDADRQRMADLTKQQLSDNAALQRAVITGEYGLQGRDITGQYGNQQAAIAGKWGMARDQNKLDDPFNQFAKYGQGVGSLFFMNPQAGQNALQALPTNVSQGVMPNMTPEVMNGMLGNKGMPQPNQANQTGFGNGLSKYKMMFNQLRGLPQGE